MRWYEREDEFGCTANPFVCNLGQIFGGGSKTTTSSPWGPQIPYLQEGFKGAEDLYKNYDPQYYPGKQVAPFNQMQRQGLNSIFDMASQGDPTATAAQKFSTDTLNGKYLNSNPYQDQTAKSVLSQVLPGIQAQFAHGGSLNNPSAAYASAQGATAALAPIEYQNYQNNIQNMLKAEALAPQTQQLSYFAPNMMLNAGGLIQQQKQQGINADKSKWDYNQQLPYQQLQNFMQMIQGNYGGTQRETSNPSLMDSLTSLSSMGGGFGQLGSGILGIGSGAAGGMAGGLDALMAFL